MAEDRHDPELTRLEAFLQSLAPHPAALDRDRLMYQAGRTSAAGRGWLWPSASAVLAAAVAVLGAALWLRPDPAVVERVVYLPPPAPVDEPAPVTGPPVQADYLRLRQEVLLHGVDVLARPPAPSAEGPSRPPEDEPGLSPWTLQPLDQPRPPDPAKPGDPK